MKISHRAYTSSHPLYIFPRAYVQRVATDIFIPDCAIFSSCQKAIVKIEIVLQFRPSKCNRRILSVCPTGRCCLKKLPCHRGLPP